MPNSRLEISRVGFGYLQPLNVAHKSSNQFGAHGVAEEASVLRDVIRQNCPTDLGPWNRGNSLISRRVPNVSPPAENRSVAARRNTFGCRGYQTVAEMYHAKERTTKEIAPGPGYFCSCWEIPDVSGQGDAASIIV
jgi:hypothetical protein